jgi:hypothetical protein
LNLIGEGADLFTVNLGKKLEFINVSFGVIEFNNSDTTCINLNAESLYINNSIFSQIKHKQAYFQKSIILVVNHTRAKTIHINQTHFSFIEPQTQGPGQLFFLGNLSGLSVTFEYCTFVRIVLGIFMRDWCIVGLWRN